MATKHANWNDTIISLYILHGCSLMWFLYCFGVFFLQMNDIYGLICLSIQYWFVSMFTLFCSYLCLTKKCKPLISSSRIPVLWQHSIADDCKRWRWLLQGIKAILRATPWLAGRNLEGNRKKSAISRAIEPNFGRKKGKWGQKADYWSINRD